MTSKLLLRVFAAGAFAWLTPSVGAAQQRPTAGEASTILQSRADLVAQLQARLLATGMTPQQVHDRLRAEGYPETLLDSYMPGVEADTSAVPSDDVFAALRSLRISDSTA